MKKQEEVLVALVPAALVLAVVWWFDAGVLASFRPFDQPGDYYSTEGIAGLYSVGALLIAGAVLFLGALAWASRSRVVGLIYLVVGLVLALLPWLDRAPASVTVVGTQSSGPFLGDVLSGLVDTLRIHTAGPLEAVSIVGAGMALAGIAALVRAALSAPAPTPSIAGAAPATNPATATPD